MAHTAIVQSYCERDKSKSAAELQFYQSLSFTQAVSAAALALKPNWRRHGHQRWAPQASLHLAESRLHRAANRLHDSRTFHDLFCAIEQFTSNIPGLGELYFYDTALRVGINLGLEPRYVYLHRGTREGAKALGLKNFRSPWIEVSDLPRTFQKLRPRELEDLLCVYREQLRPQTAG